MITAIAAVSIGTRSEIERGTGVPAVESRAGCACHTARIAALTLLRRGSYIRTLGDVAELADAQVSEACDGDIVEVQVLSSPPCFWASPVNRDSPFLIGLEYRLKAAS